MKKKIIKIFDSYALRVHFFPFRDNYFFSNPFLSEWIKVEKKTETNSNKKY